MTLLPFNGALIALVSLTSLAVIGYWWTKTRGSWMHWPAGRSLMGLLGILAIVTGWASANVLFLPRDYPGKALAYMLLYILLEAALVVIGITIHREMRRGKARQAHLPAPVTGSIDITVADDLKENGHV